MPNETIKGFKIDNQVHLIDPEALKGELITEVILPELTVDVTPTNTTFYYYNKQTDEIEKYFYIYANDGIILPTHLFSSLSLIRKNEDYIVSYDDTEYICKAILVDSQSYQQLFLGNCCLKGYSSNNYQFSLNEDYPFLLIIDLQTNIISLLTISENEENSSTHTIKIEHQKSTSFNNNLLPEELQELLYTNTLIFFGTDMTFEYDSWYEDYEGNYSGLIDDSIEVVSGDTYIVDIDNNIYTCECIYDSMNEKNSNTFYYYLVNENMPFTIEVGKSYGTGLYQEFRIVDLNANDTTYHTIKIYHKEKMNILDTRFWISFYDNNINQMRYFSTSLIELLQEILIDISILKQSNAMSISKNMPNDYLNSFIPVASDS